MLSTKMTRKGQVTIPKDIRDQMKIVEGDKIAFIVRDNEILIKPLRGSVLDLRGSVEPKNRPEDFDQIRQIVRQRRAQQRLQDCG